MTRQPCRPGISWVEPLKEDVVHSGTSAAGLGSCAYEMGSSATLNWFRGFQCPEVSNEHGSERKGRMKSVYFTVFNMCCFGVLARIEERQSLEVFSRRKTYIKLWSFRR